MSDLNWVFVVVFWSSILVALAFASLVVFLSYLGRSRRWAVIIASVFVLVAGVAFLTPRLMHEFVISPAGGVALRNYLKTFR